MNRFLSWIAAVGFSAVLFSGCAKYSNNQTQTAPQAFVNMMHMAPYSPAVDVFFNTDKVSQQAIQPLVYSLFYAPFQRGMKEVIFKKSGADSLVASLPPVLFDSLQFYTLLLYNESPTLVKAFRITDDFTNTTVDKAYWRFFHLGPDAPAVDFYLDNVKLASNRQYTDNIVNLSYNQFQSSNSGSYTIYVKQAGTNTILTQLDNVSLLQGNAYTIFLKGLDGALGNKALSIAVLRAAR